MKKLLVVAYSFPPCSVTGTHRTLAFVKYLAGAGWRSTVLCAENPLDPERDESLLAQIPEHTKVERTRDHDVLDRLQRLWRRYKNHDHAAAETPLGTRGWHPWRSLTRAVALRLRPPNHNPGWYLSTLRAGRVLQKQDRVDALYSSGPPWTAHLVAARLAQEFGIPWVADFRDPWVGNPLLEVPRESARRRNAAEEARVVARADAVVCVLDTMREDFLARYPRRRPEDVVTILNGFDPVNFAGLDAGAAKDSGNSAARLSILHAGQVYGRRRIEPFLTALNQWLRTEPAMAGRLEACFIGGSASHVTTLRSRVREAGAQALVEVESEIPHGAVLGRLAKATVLLLVGFAGAGDQYQMSGKIFEYLALRRPILALAPPAGPVGDVLRAAGVRHWIVSPDDTAGISRALAEIAKAWRRGELAGPQSNSSLATYNRREQAGRLSDVLSQVVARKGAASPA